MYLVKLSVDLGFLLTTNGLIICGCPKVRINNSYPLRNEKDCVNRVESLLTTMESVCVWLKKQAKKKKCLCTFIDINNREV